MVDQGVRLVINMRFERPPYISAQPLSLRFLWLPCFDSPLLPIPLSFLDRGVREALKVIDGGGQVYTHCAGGAHRGVAMGAAILIGLGYAPETATNLISEKRPAADPEVWYIRRQIHKFARRWRAGAA